MRVKALLLFVFLFTGMAFSQEGAVDERIEFSMIRMILKMQHISNIATYVEQFGYKKSDAGFRNKNHGFGISSKSDKGPFTYSENIDDKARYDELLKDALAAGMVVTKKNTRGDYELKGKGFQVNLSKGYFQMENLK